MTLLEDIQAAVLIQSEIQERRKLVEHPGFQPGMKWLEQSVPTLAAFAVTPDYRVIGYGPDGRTELGIWDVFTALTEGHRIYFNR